MMLLGLGIAWVSEIGGALGVNARRILPIVTQMVSAEHAAAVRNKCLNLAKSCLVTASTPEPEGGARCVSSARRDLRGGRGEILVPTATIRSASAEFAESSGIANLFPAGISVRI